MQGSRAFFSQILEKEAGGGGCGARSFTQRRKGGAQRTQRIKPQKAQRARRKKGERRDLPRPLPEIRRGAVRVLSRFTKQLRACTSLVSLYG